MHKHFNNTQDWLDFDRDHLWHPYTSMADALPCYPIVAAKGAYLELANGKQLLDGMSSWWSAIHGYSQPRLVQAGKDQLETMSHVMFGGITHPSAVELSSRLINITPAPLQHVFLADSGSIAVEVSLKIALQYWQSKGKTNKQKILTVRGGYHGDSLGCMSVGDPENGRHNLFNGVLPKQIFVDKPSCNFEDDWDPSDIASLRDELTSHHNEIAAVILEPIVQGAGGMHFYHPSYLRDLRALCDEFNVLLIFDEIATGFGRTGKLFALEHAHVCPDILTLGKAITGGMLTLAATLTTTKVAEGISQGSCPVLMHGPTFMGNPLACQIACQSIDLLLETGKNALYPEGWKNKITEIETTLQSLNILKNHPEVADVRILGAIGVVEMKQAVDVAKIQSVLVEQGVWLRPFGKLIYTMPPYILKMKEQKKLCSSIIALIENLY